MQKKADLHVHTSFSDSTFPPGHVVDYAAKIGLACIAICDHDVIDGIEPAMRAAQQHGLEIIPGVELTAEKQGSEIHILGFFIDWQDTALRRRLAQLCEQRIQRIRDMVDKLKGHGIVVDAEEVFALGGEGSVGRLHLARAMHQGGHTKTVEEAFRKYIGNGKPCHVSKINLTPEDAIGEIVKAKGVPVLAHPGVMGNDGFIASYVKGGLRGIEVYHPEHPPALSRHYEKLAGQYDLLMTGGSDCHGYGKERILMGSVTVPYELVEKLKDERR